MQQQEPHQQQDLPEKPVSQAESEPAMGSLQRAWLYGALAMELTVGVVGGALGGYALDHWQGTSPLWTVILLVLGFAGGFTLMLRGFSKLEDKWQ